ncbi:hypothetical protein P5673_015052, partial [Acropora cervicornis]
TSTQQPSQGKSPWIPETPLSSSENSSAIDTYNAAINKIALLTAGDEARDADKKKIIEKASEYCLLVETIDHPARDDLVMLMTAYKNATSKNLNKFSAYMLFDTQQKPYRQSIHLMGNFQAGK